MSIPAALAELNKEIVTLDKAITEAEKKKARLIGVRDALLKEDRESGGAPARKAKPGRRPRATKKSKVASRAAVVKKTVGANKSAASKKRVMSVEARKRIAEAQKKRWAAQKASVKV
jgi:hypothetical protein